jgi:hypothetical protein
MTLSVLTVALFFVFQRRFIAGISAGSMRLESWGTPHSWMRAPPARRVTGEGQRER